ncbi:MAG: trigger factor [Lachnospiraceae bacterium]|nr:trigger factor [Lachnospiraceae bacterium]
MKRRKYLTFAAVVLSVAMMAGCGDQKKEEKAKTEEIESESEEKKTEETEGKEVDPETVLDFKASDYVTLGDYKKLPVEYPTPSVSDEEVEMYIEEQLAENVTYEEMDRAAQEGDCVKIDYTGTIDGEEFEGGSEEDCEIILGEGDMLEEFEENLFGKKAGEEFTFSLVFPEDYYEELAGKKAEFAVTVKSVSEVNMPEYDEAFIEKVSEYHTKEEYESSIKEELLADSEAASVMEAQENALKLAVMNSFTEEYPEPLYDLFYDQMKESYEIFAEMFGQEFEEEDVKEEALNLVNEFLVVKAIAEKEGIEVTQEEYQKEAEKLAKESEYESLEEFEGDYGKADIMIQIIRQRVVEFLYDSAELKEIPSEEYYQEESLDGEEIELEDEELDGEEIKLEEESSDGEKIELEDEELDGEEIKLEDGE